MSEKKVLYADLTRNSTDIKMERIDAIGGADLASKLLKKHSDALIFATGVFSGTPVPAGSVVGVFTSSGQDYLTGNFGSQMRFAGFDAFVITGRAERPSALWIDDEGADIERADTLWGLDTFETLDKIARDTNDQTAAAAVIGPAGEQQVKLASIFCDDQLETSDIGSVMGSKLLKAVIVRGSKDVKVASHDELNKAAQQKKEVPSKMRKDLSAKKLPKNRSCVQCNIACREAFKANGVITTIFPEQAEAFGKFKADEVIEAIALCKRLGLDPIYAGALANASKGKLSDFIKSLAVRQKAEQAEKAAGQKPKKPEAGNKLFNSLMICKRAPYSEEELGKLYKLVTGEAMPAVR